MWRPVNDEDSPEGRIAAAASNLMLEMQERHLPDYADFRDRLRLFIERERLLTRLEERLLFFSDPYQDRNEEIHNRLREVNRELAPFLSR